MGSSQSLPHEVNILFNDLSYLYFNNFEAFEILSKSEKLCTHICDIISKLIYIMTGKKIDEPTKLEFKPKIRNCLVNHGGVVIFPFEDEKGEIILDWQPSIQDNVLFLNVDFFESKKRKLWNTLSQQGRRITEGNSEHFFNSTHDNTPCDLCHVKEKQLEHSEHIIRQSPDSLTIKLGKEDEFSLLRKKLAKWSESNTKAIETLVGTSKHPFETCFQKVKDGFPNEGAASAYCAKGLDILMGTTQWRSKDWEGWDKYYNKMKVKKKKKNKK